MKLYICKNYIFYIKYILYKSVIYNCTLIIYIHTSKLIVININLNKF